MQGRLHDLEAGHVLVLRGHVAFQAHEQGHEVVHAALGEHVGLLAELLAHLEEAHGGLLQAGVELLGG